MIVRLPNLLSTADVDAVLEKTAGVEWQDGKNSAHGKARAAKHNLVLPSEHAATSAAGLLILDRLSRSDTFRAATLAKTVLPFMFCKYDEGMSYGAHLDLPLMGKGEGAIRTDLSMTIFLSAPDSYAGGDLVLDSEYGEQRVRGGLGEAVIYPATVLHRVEPVSRGSRVVGGTFGTSAVFGVRRFGVRESDVYPVLRSLTYFDDAERETGMPNGLTPDMWDHIKLGMTRRVVRALKALG